MYNGTECSVSSTHSTIRKTFFQQCASILLATLFDAASKKNNSMVKC